MSNGNICNGRNVPLPIRRQVRQRCGFGCVICGRPLYEFDHLEGWANVHRHVADEITLLCDQHHRERTSGLLPTAKVREANDAPRNLQAGVSKPYELHYSGSSAEIVVGGNSFTCGDFDNRASIVAICIDNMPLLAFTHEDDHLLLTMRSFDEDNHLVLEIEDNILAYSIAPWDIELVGKSLTVRQPHRNILLHIEFEPPGRILIDRGRTLANGVELLIRPSSVLVSNDMHYFRGNSVSNCYAGLTFGQYDGPKPVAFPTPRVSRYLGNREELSKYQRECDQLVLPSSFDSKEIL